MGILDRSSSRTELTENTVNNVLTETYGQQGVEGVAGIAGGDLEIRIDQIDSGVVAAARGISDNALSFAGDTVAATLRAQGDTSADAFNFGGDALRKVGDVVSDAFNFGGKSLTAVSGLAGDSIEAQNRVVEYSLQANRDTLRDALDFGSSAVNKTISTLSSAIGQAADATRSDASNVLNNAIKYGAIAAVLFGAFMVFRKRAA